MRRKSIYSFLCFSVLTLIIITQNTYPQETKPKVRVIKEDALVRLKPNKESLIIKKLPLGSELDIVETVGEWIKINLPPDKDGIVITGYIHNYFVEFEVSRILIPTEKKPKISHEKGDHYFEWQRELARAGAKRGSGTILVVFGSLMCAPSLYFVLRGPGEGKYYYSWAKIAFGTGIGLGVISIVIGVTMIQSGGELKQQLLQEGKARGYIKAGLLPEYRAIGFQIGASF